MYYPKQIPYLLNKKFQENIEYKEYNIKELENYCMCIWQMKSKRILGETIYNNILPDACIDIVIDFTNKSICFAGFSKDGYHWEISDEPIAFQGAHAEVAKRDYRYDPRVCFIEDRYYITWCNGYHGYPTIGVGYTFDFQTF